MSSKILGNFNQQKSDYKETKAIKLNDNSFYIVSGQNNYTTGSYTIRGQAFDRDGNNITSQCLFLEQSSSTFNPVSINIGKFLNNSLIVEWVQNNGANYGIYAKVINTDCSSNAHFLINQIPAINIEHSALGVFENSINLILHTQTDVFELISLDHNGNQITHIQPFNPCAEHKIGSVDVSFNNRNIYLIWNCRVNVKNALSFNINKYDSNFTQLASYNTPNISDAFYIEKVSLAMFNDKFLVTWAQIDNENSTNTTLVSGVYNATFSEEISKDIILSRENVLFQVFTTNFDSTKYLVSWSAVDYLKQVSSISITHTHKDTQTRSKVDSISVTDSVVKDTNTQSQSASQSLSKTPRDSYTISKITTGTKSNSLSSTISDSNSVSDTESLSLSNSLSLSSSKETNSEKDNLNSRTIEHTNTGSSSESSSFTETYVEDTQTPGATSSHMISETKNQTNSPESTNSEHLSKSFSVDNLSNTKSNTRNTNTQSQSISESLSHTLSNSDTSSKSATSTDTESLSETKSNSNTITDTESKSLSQSESSSYTSSKSGTSSNSNTVSESKTNSISSTASDSTTNTESQSLFTSNSASYSSSDSSTPSVTQTHTESLSSSDSNSNSVTETQTQSESNSLSHTSTDSNTLSKSATNSSSLESRTKIKTDTQRVTATEQKSKSLDIDSTSHTDSNTKDTDTQTQSVSQSLSYTSSNSVTSSNSETSTDTESVSGTKSDSKSITDTRSQSVSQSKSSSYTSSSSHTPSDNLTRSDTKYVTTTESNSNSITASQSPSLSQSRTSSLSNTKSETDTLHATNTKSISDSANTLSTLGYTYLYNSSFDLAKKYNIFSEPSTNPQLVDVLSFSPYGFFAIWTNNKNILGRFFEIDKTQTKSLSNTQNNFVTDTKATDQSSTQSSMTYSHTITDKVTGSRTSSETLTSVTMSESKSETMSSSFTATASDSFTDQLQESETKTLSKSSSDEKSQNNSKQASESNSMTSLSVSTSGSRSQNTHSLEHTESRTTSISRPLTQSDSNTSTEPISFSNTLKVTDTQTISEGNTKSRTVLNSNSKITSVSNSLDKDTVSHTQTESQSQAHTHSHSTTNSELKTQSQESSISYSKSISSSNTDTNILTNTPTHVLSNSNKNTDTTSKEQSLSKALSDTLTNEKTSTHDRTDTVSSYLTTQPLNKTKTSTRSKHDIVLVPTSTAINNSTFTPAPSTGGGPSGPTPAPASPPNSPPSPPSSPGSPPSSPGDNSHPHGNFHPGIPCPVVCFIGALTALGLPFAALGIAAELGAAGLEGAADLFSGGDDEPINSPNNFDDDLPDEPNCEGTANRQAAVMAISGSDSTCENPNPPAQLDSTILATLAAAIPTEQTSGSSGSTGAGIAAIPMAAMAPTEFFHYCTSEPIHFDVVSSVVQQFYGTPQLLVVQIVSWPNKSMSLMFTTTQADGTYNPSRPIYTSPYAIKNLKANILLDNSVLLSFVTLIIGGSTFVMTSYIKKGQDIQLKYVMNSNDGSYKITPILTKGYIASAMADQSNLMIRRIDFGVKEAVFTLRKIICNPIISYDVQAAGDETFTLVWSNLDKLGIYAQKYFGDGNLLNAEVHLASNPVYFNTDTNVNGAYVIAWQERNCNLSSNIFLSYAQMFTNISQISSVLTTLNTDSWTFLDNIKMVTDFVYIAYLIDYYNSNYVQRAFVTDGTMLLNNITSLNDLQSTSITLSPTPTNQNREAIVLAPGECSTEMRQRRGNNQIPNNENNANTAQDTAAQSDADGADAAARNINSMTRTQKFVLGGAVFILGALGVGAIYCTIHDCKLSTTTPAPTPSTSEPTGISIPPSLAPSPPSLNCNKLKVAYSQISQVCEATQEQEMQLARLCNTLKQTLQYILKKIKVDEKLQLTYKILICKLGPSPEFISTIKSMNSFLSSDLKFIFGTKCTYSHTELQKIFICRDMNLDNFYQSIGILAQALQHYRDSLLNNRCLDVAKACSQNNYISTADCRGAFIQRAYLNNLTKSESLSLTRDNTITESSTADLTLTKSFSSTEDMSISKSISQSITNSESKSNSKSTSSTSTESQSLTKTQSMSFSQSMSKSVTSSESFFSICRVFNQILSLGVLCNANSLQEQNLVVAIEALELALNNVQGKYFPLQGTITKLFCAKPQSLYDPLIRMYRNFSYQSFQHQHIKYDFAKSSCISSTDYAIFTSKQWTWPNTALSGTYNMNFCNSYDHLSSLPTLLSIKSGIRSKMEVLAHGVSILTGVTTSGNTWYNTSWCESQALMCTRSNNKFQLTSKNADCLGAFLEATYVMYSDKIVVNNNYISTLYGFSTVPGLQQSILNISKALHGTLSKILAISSFSTLNTSLVSVYKTYICNDTSSNSLAAFKNKMQLMLDLLNGEIQYNYEAISPTNLYGSAAANQTSGSAIINLNNAFIRAKPDLPNGLSHDTKYDTVSHELSHAAYGTNDNDYDFRSCLSDASQCTVTSLLSGNFGSIGVATCIEYFLNEAYFYL